MKKILVIDDDGIVRDALNVFLSRAGYKVFTAADGLNGLNIFQNNNPDLIILDRNLPDITGSKVLDKIRQYSKTIPVIILTGYDDPEDARRYIEYGATLFISKANGLSKVLEEVNYILNEENEIKKEEIFIDNNKSSNVKILIAEDDEQLRNIISRHIKNMGYEPIMSADGREAIEFFRINKPDIVLLDIAMPELSGIEVLKEIMKISPETGVIMITGNEDEDIARECLKLGAFDYYSKPVNFKNLEISIRARLIFQEKL